MDTFLRDIVERVRAFFARLDRGQRIRLVALSVALLAVIITAVVLLNNTPYDVLYSKLSAKDAGEIMARLQELNVSAKPSGSDSIMVPATEVDALRWQLASEGLPSSSSSQDDYSTYLQGTAFGSTDEDKKFFLQAQLEEKTRNSILTYEKIQDASVKVNLATTSIFVLADETPASASVILKIKEDQKLSDSEARTIAMILTTAVPDLSLDNIQIADTRMRLYNVTEPSDDEVLSEQFQLIEAQQRKFEQRVVEFLAPVYGRENVAAFVKIEMDFDSRVTQSTVLQPPVAGSDTGIPIAMEQLTESIRGAQNVEGVPGTGTNGFDSYPTDNAGGDDVYSKASTKFNYDVNEIKTQIESAKGTITDITLSVIVNDALPDYNANLQALLASALGTDAKHIAVDRLPFQEPPADDTFTLLEGLEQNRNTQSLINTIILALAIIVVFVLLYLIARGFMPKKAPQTITAIDAATGMPIDIMVGEDGELPELPAAPPEPTKLDEIMEFVKANPEGAASLLRNWLQD